MEDKRIIYLSAIIALIVSLLIASGFFIYFRVTHPAQQPPATPSEPVATTTAQTLPSTDGSVPGEAAPTSTAEQLARERRFISTYYQPVATAYTAQVPAYPLPVPDIKERAVNYRDFSRKIAIDSALPQLTANGFVSLPNTLPNKPANWQQAYQTLSQQRVPLVVTSDAVVGVYQDTLQTMYKEIEQENFYPTLWNLLQTLFAKTKDRYESRRQQFGIEATVNSEANRLELAYLTVALKLLEPESKQVKETISINQTFFSPYEAEQYSFQVPTYLATEVAQEINLINTRSGNARSPIFLYNRSYQNFAIPAQYQSSEKLKNYYLTLRWLNEGLFPLYSKADNCPNCLLDEADHRINFVAATLLSHDLASDQKLKNRWATIYKSISFFRGLEVNLTYLDYDRALKKMFGDTYALTDIFGGDTAAVKKNVGRLQTAIATTPFPTLLQGTRLGRAETGLRVLRNYHLLENTVLQQLSGTTTGQYTSDTGKQSPLPPTACTADRQIIRCWPLGLDILNLLGNLPARQLIVDSHNAAYQQYGAQLTQLTAGLNQFDDNTWHDNGYLSLFAALGSLNHSSTAGYPPFMQTDAWKKKTLTTILGGWVDFHRDLTYEKTTPTAATGFESYFGYGYVEPQPELYAQLLANTRMIKKGLLELQIISPNSKPADRLDNLTLLLERTLSIAQTELNNKPLTIEDYTFINGFDRQIRTVTGDITPARLTVTSQITIPVSNGRTLKERIDGLRMLVILYPDSQGKILMAIGPVYDYQETTGSAVTTRDWQAAYYLKP